MKILCFFIIFYSAFLNAKELPIFYFEPQESIIVGTLEIQTFPGAPGYESIANGDAIESCWYLRLAKPVNVLVRQDRKNKIDNNSTSTFNVKIIQLVIMDEPLLFKKLLIKNKKVTATGTLFSSFTGHHHARVLMEVHNIVESR